MTRRRHIFEAVKVAASDDSGVAMITVVGVIGLMTILALMAFAMSQQSTLDSTRTAAKSLAFQAANAGVDAGLTRIQRLNYVESDWRNPATGALKALEGTLTVDATKTVGTYSVTVEPTMTASGSKYICTSTGMDPSGRSETIVVTFGYINIWNMNLATTGGASGKIKGNSSFWGPLYVLGDFSTGPSNKGGYAHGPLLVKNGAFTGGNILDDISLYISPGFAYPTTDPRIVYVSNDVPDITLPPVDLVDAMNTAADESSDNWRGSFKVTANDEATETGRPTYPRTKAPGASSCYKIIANQSAVDASPKAPAAYGTGPGLTIGPGTSWGQLGANHDDFAWDATNGILYVEGTVFIDGNLTVTSPVKYVGNGTIIVNGKITLAETWVANTTTDTATVKPGYMDAEHAVGLVTPGDIETNGAKGNPMGEFSEPDYSGAFFCEKTFTALKKAIYKGAIHAGTIDCGGNNNDFITDPNLANFIPAGLPGAGTSYLLKSSWSRR